MSSFDVLCGAIGFMVMWACVIGFVVGTIVALCCAHDRCRQLEKAMNREIEDDDLSAAGVGAKDKINPGPIGENWVITSAGDEEIDGPAKPIKIKEGGWNGGTYVLPGADGKWTVGIDPAAGKSWTENTYADKAGTFADMTRKFSDLPSYAAHPEASTFPWGY